MRSAQAVRAPFKAAGIVEGRFEMKKPQAAIGMGGNVQTRGVELTVD